MNGSAFRAYVEQVLAPTLKPGDVVVPDNLSPTRCPGYVKGSKPRAQGCFTRHPIPASTISLFLRSALQLSKLYSVESRSKTAFEFFLARRVEDQATPAQTANPHQLASLIH
jgi:hypothetical protein